MPKNQRRVRALHRRMGGQLSVALKIGIPLVLVTVFAAIILGISAVRTAEGRIDEAFATEAEGIASDVSAQWQISQDESEMVSHLSGLLETHTSISRIRLISGAFGSPPSVWHSTTPSDDGNEFPVSQLAGKDEYRQREVTLAELVTIETVVPIEINSGTVVSLATYTKGAVRDAAISEVRMDTAVAAAFVIILEFLVMFPTLYILVIRRVRSLGKAASAVASGDFSYRLPEAVEDPGRDELAAVAKEFDRMIVTVGARQRQQAAVTALGQTALAGTDLSPLLDETAGVIATQLDTDFSSILELGPDGGLVLRAGRGWTEGLIGFATVDSTENEQSRFTLDSGEPVVMPDIDTEERFTPSALQRDHGIVSSAAVTIPGRDGIFGILGASTATKREFSDDDLNFLKAVASVLAAGIERKRAEETVTFMAHHDELTKLPNRAMFEELLELAMARARRNELSVAVLFMDLDNFKLVNDSLGHQAGDELLAELGDRLREATRNTDLVARQGGDEFLILLSDIERESEVPLPEGTDNAQLIAESVAVRVHQAFEEPFILQGQEFYGSASIGISMFPQDADDSRALLKNADAAMYKSKKTAPGGYIIYSTDGADSMGKLSLTTRLRKAVDAQHWLLHYQPLVDLNTGELVGVEALIRWQDPNGGLVQPGEFIPLAEEMGLIVAIGDWVMEDICRQSRDWLDQGMDLKISFNLSPRQLWQPEVVEKIMGHLESANVSPERVAIEITESSVMTDPERSQRVLWDLHARGVRLAIDDFGTGYSSLSRLKHMPVHTLKIDRSFVMDIPDDADAGKMAEAIIRLSESLGMTPLAEGIETVEQWRFLRDRGCLLGQGYYFSRPVPADEILTMWRENPGSIWTMPEDETADRAES